MPDNAALYRTFFAEEERFLSNECQEGFEYDIIVGYISAGLNLTGVYCSEGAQTNALLEELFLRRVYYNMLMAIGCVNRSDIFRQLCIDHIHGPLIALKRYYIEFDGGHEKFLSLQHDLQKVCFFH
ncbi:hypothetical protein CS022_10930 [Veronia nyctiphanis]|uniref:Uncharacterized protein n=1 Tax=Veronia nyctiphanis TaxID=1278244 RepID=A0A4Q0YSY5_9GAMM|nr:hypothetical protein [Veronia nyctiphanis]RXJ73244.1 hypothetical protein CS022_10930 [Veronia nyctiphanis]